MKGQSIFEFIIFLPFMLFLLTVIVTIGNAINGSINQQKAVRRYFFYLYKGNSTIPTSQDITNLSQKGAERIGASSIGWREKSGGGDLYFGTCYPFSTLFSENEDDECFEPVLEEGKTNFVRVFTMFGVCGETYYRPDGDYFIPDRVGRIAGGNCSNEKP